jgi:hypothetical protein
MLIAECPDRRGALFPSAGAPYRSGRVKIWVKVKNPDTPASLRFRDAAPADLCDKP